MDMLKVAEITEGTPIIEHMIESYRTLVENNIRGPYVVSLDKNAADWFIRAVREKACKLASEHIPPFRSWPMLEGTKAIGVLIGEVLVCGPAS